jgi:RHS repeat-associated protein
MMQEVCVTIHPSVCARQFTGKERDQESGLDYFGARYYSSNMGRWMSPDPGWFMFANILNPQSLNLYNHALNNPLAFIDIDGLELVRAVTATGQSVVVDRSIADDVISLVRDASAAGLQVTITSGFRSMARQAQLYNAYKNGQSRYPAASPGHSGHNSGQSVDMTVRNGQINLLSQIARRNGLPWAGRIDAVHFGAGFGIPIDPTLIQENGIDHPYPDSTIVDGGTTTVDVTTTATTVDLDNSNMVPDLLIPIIPPPDPPPPPPPPPPPQSDK